MNNKLVAGLVLGFTLLIGFAAGRFTAASDTVARVAGDKPAGKPKVTTTKRSAYRPPNVEALASSNTAEPAPDSTTNRPGGRGRGNFDPAAYAAAMKERAVAERTAFFTNARLTPAQQQDFDDLVIAMNSALKARTEKFAALTKGGKAPPPEVLYQMLHEYGSTMTHAYAMMDRTMPAGWRELAGGNFNMRNFLDPSLREATRGFRNLGGGPPR